MKKSKANNGLNVFSHLEVSET